MSRRDIADYLGLTIETVCRALSKFKRRGLIELEGRNRVVLRCLEDLQALTGEDEVSCFRCVSTGPRRRVGDIGQPYPAKKSAEGVHCETAAR
jgi:hypothetical protein